MFQVDEVLAPVRTEQGMSEIRTSSVENQFVCVYPVVFRSNNQANVAVVLIPLSEHTGKTFSV